MGDYTATMIQGEGSRILRHTVKLSSLFFRVADPGSILSGSGSEKTGSKYDEKPGSATDLIRLKILIVFSTN